MISKTYIISLGDLRDLTDQQYMRKRSISESDGQIWKSYFDHTITINMCWILWRLRQPQQIWGRQ